jgi:hypothetical protein
MQYPTDRRMANYYWRLFHKFDPVFGTAMDMYSEMLVSDYDVIVDDTEDTTINDTIALMCEKTHFQERFRQMVVQFNVIGEVFPHLFFDEDLGIWTYIAMHNPDYIEVQDSPIVDMEPIISFLPDEALIDLLSDRSPEAMELRRSLPSEFVSKVLARQPIRLQNSNCSFIARKMNPYDERGTSLASRLWRIWMVEDAVYASSIATYRRNAGPLKIAKLGDASTNWIPEPAVEAELLSMLGRMETDPQCFVPETLVTQFDGTQVPIGDLVLGDQLLDKDGEVCEVLALESEDTHDLVELDVVGSPLIKCTPTHKWPVWGGPRTCSCGCGTSILRGNYAPKHGGKVRSPRYKTFEGAPKRVAGVKVRFLEDFNPYQKLTADQIRPGDYLMIPRTFEKAVSEGVTPEKARLLGYYAAEGNTKLIYEREDGSQRVGVELSFNRESDIDRGFVEDACTILEGLCGYRPPVAVSPDPEVKWCQIRAFRNASSGLAEWLGEHGGHYAKTKKLSKEVMAWPLDLKYEFLKGYLAGDGSSTRMTPEAESRYVEVGSASRNLMNQVKLILAQCGSYASFSERVQSENSLSPGKIQYRLHLYGSLAAKLSEDVWGYACPVPESRKVNWWLDEDYIYVKVRSVKAVELGEPQQVINMTVSGDHSYLTDCIGTRNSWLVWNYGIQFEAFGTNDRAITIKGEHDVIEKVKLLGMGLSKSFMTGDVTFASAKSGLQVFLRRLLSLRQYLEAVWLYPKFFRPISLANDWVKSKPNEVAHSYRVKRTAQELEDQKLIIMPKLKWHNKLDPEVDRDVLQAYLQMEKFGFQVSKASVGSVVDLDWENELRNSAEEFKKGREIVQNVLGDQMATQFWAEKAPKKPGGAAGGGAPPGGPGGGQKPSGAAGGAPGGPKPDASNPPGSGAAGEPEGGIESPDQGGMGADL